MGTPISIVAINVYNLPNMKYRDACQMVSLRYVGCLSIKLTSLQPLA